MRPGTLTGNGSGAHDAIIKLRNERDCNRAGESVPRILVIPVMTHDMCGRRNRQHDATTQARQCFVSPSDKAGHLLMGDSSSASNSRAAAISVSL